ncbi:MAG: glycosyl hydrolase family 17 protein [Gammaproteobacteria bacterium]|nr:glycosyl hydrolase family 17 protein [Gammaproteobacteria bacterium]MDH5694496.1 glycosyl hydrolase family 17 protein [Gammaproteobacteria bacterium]
MSNLSVHKIAQLGHRLLFVLNRNLKTFKKLPSLFTFILIVLTGTACVEAVEGQTMSTGPYQVHGLNFSPYTNGLDPRRGDTLSESHIIAHLDLVKQNTSWVRTFGMSNGQENIGRLAHQLGLKVALGAWLDADLGSNKVELDKLISAAKRGEADMVIVGGEVLLRGDFSERQLVRYIKQVRRAIPSHIPVAYNDVHTELLAHPKVVSAVDVVLANYYPYWEDVAVENAMKSVHQWHRSMITAANGKPVVVGETGWPSAGGNLSNAIASETNAAFYFLNFVSWARANVVDYFYFETFDEQWKENYPGSPNSHWGLWDGFGNLKPGMELVFNGEVMADNWSDSTTPGGAGVPALEFAYVPPLGSLDDLVGKALHVDPAAYHVAVYIYVGGGWWTKPTFDQPATTIEVDGYWITDITTGGIDEQATQIAAFLLPINLAPPLAAGEVDLPTELQASALSSVFANR